jgi:hypothetical protein
MNKKKFEKIMDDWAAHEMEAAPELEPGPEVYKKLEEKKKRSKFVLFSWPVRLAAAGIAVTLIVLVIVLQPPKEVEPLLGLRKPAVPEEAARQESADRMQVLGEEKVDEKTEAREDQAGKAKSTKLRKEMEEGLKGEETEKKENIKPQAKTKAVQEIEKAREADKKADIRPKEAAARSRIDLEPEKKELKSQVKSVKVAAAVPSASVSERMEFQYQSKGSGATETLGFNETQDEILSLSSEDHYRLLLQLPQDGYIYVFKAAAGAPLIRLFPNADYSPSQNPLQAGKTHFVPLPPNWFYVEKDAGEVQIFVVTSAGPLQDWDNRDADIAVGWLDRIKKLRESSASEVYVRLFKFTVQ